MCNDCSGHDRHQHHKGTNDLDAQKRGKVKIYTDAHPCGVYVYESKAKYAIANGLASREVPTPHDQRGINAHPCAERNYTYCVSGVPVKHCEPECNHTYDYDYDYDYDCKCKPTPKPCQSKPKQCQSKPKPCQSKPKPCQSKSKTCKNPVSVECDLEFKLLKTHSGSTVSSGSITQATQTTYLTLCCDTAKLSVDLKSDVKRIVLGVPLLHLDNCYVYSLVPPDIANANLSTTVYSENIEVVDLVTGTILPVGLQVSNGYLLIEIDVDNKVVVDNCNCSGSVILCFNTFKFALSARPNCCDVDCYPITWNSTYPVNPIVEPEPIIIESPVPNC
jgi:hypothetical protein